MHLGAPQPIHDDIQPPRMVWKVRAEDCTLDEPMILSLRRKKGDVWEKKELLFPDWVAAIKAAYTVCCRLDPKRAESDCYYMIDFRDGKYRPKTPWWVRSDGTSILFIWPKRVIDDYHRRLGEGTAYPMPGDEHLFVKNTL